jgi:phosphohistidine phosphatase
MNLYLLRHAIAMPSGTSSGFAERQRPLTLQGRKKLRRAAKGMLALKLDFDVIFSSPYWRAKQTAEIVAEILGAEDRLNFSDHLAPNGHSDALVRQILRHAPGEVLLVGHEPYLSKLISLLISGQTKVGISMKKAGLCKLTTESLQSGRCATLEWLLTPKQLGLIE